MTEQSSYRDAVGRHGLTPAAIETGARALAEALNGGSWDTHYTAAQKALWRRRVLAAMKVD